MIRLVAPMAAALLLAAFALVVKIGQVAVKAERPIEHPVDVIGVPVEQGGARAGGRGGTSFSARVSKAPALKSSQARRTAH